MHELIPANAKCRMQLNDCDSMTHHRRAAIGVELRLCATCPRFQFTFESYIQ